MKGIFNYRIVFFLAILFGLYLFVCDFKIPIENLGKKMESTAYVDSVKQLEIFEVYNYDLIYYHYLVEEQFYSDSTTANRYDGTLNTGDSLIVVVSKMNPENNTVKSFYTRKQSVVQYMGM